MHVPEPSSRVLLNFWTYKKKNIFFVFGMINDGKWMKYFAFFFIFIVVVKCVATFSVSKRCEIFVFFFFLPTSSAVCYFGTTKKNWRYILLKFYILFDFFVTVIYKFVFFCVFQQRVVFFFQLNISWLMKLSMQLMTRRH